MISANRVRQLRLADVRTRILSEIGLCIRVLNGGHRFTGVLGGIWWLRANRDKSLCDYEVWRRETLTIAKARKASLEKRLARVDRIAGAV